MSSLEEEDDDIVAAAMPLPEKPAGIPNPNPIVTVNAGGKLFQTYRDTLTRSSGYFRAYFEGKFFAKPDPKVPVFLDMDDECFRYLLTRMRLPGHDLQGFPEEKTIPGIRAAAEFLAMDEPLPESPEKKTRQVRQELYDLAVRLQPGDRVENKRSDDTDWWEVTFECYHALAEFPWRFGGTSIRYLWFDERVWIRVTDPTERAKILARENPDLSRVVWK